MKELYSNSISSVKYKIMVDGVVTSPTGAVQAVIKDSAGNILLQQEATLENNYYKVVVPPQTSGKLYVTWDFTVAGYNQSVTEEYVVVQPFALWSDMIDSLPSTVTYADFMEAEKVARFIIESYCGQDFYQEQSIYKVAGSGMNGIALPRRLMILNSVTSEWVNRPGVLIGVNNEIQWDIIADGFLLQASRKDNALDPVYMRSYEFRRNVVYSVNGTWGYESIPAKVGEAATILTQDLLCGQHKWRDRYLTNIQFDQWRLSYAADAFNSTGNVLVDQMLSEYRLLPNAGVI